MPGADAAGEDILRTDPQHDDDAGEHQKDRDRGQHRHAPSVEVARRQIGALDVGARSALITDRSLVKAWSMRTAPIISDG